MRGGLDCESLKNLLKKVQTFLKQRQAEHKDKSPLVLCWPTDTQLQNGAERIYKREYQKIDHSRSKITKQNVWLLDLPENAATRWLLLRELVTIGKGIPHSPVILAVRNCCIDCASNIALMDPFAKNYVVLPRSRIAIREA